MKGKIKGQRKETIWGWIFVAPACMGLLIYIILPMIYSLAISFCSWDIIKVYSDFCPVHVAYNICNRFAPKCQTVKGKGIMESFDLRTFDCSDHGLFGTLDIYL